MPSWAINSTKLSNYKYFNKMEETSRNNETAQLGIGGVNNRLFIWAIIENIVTILAIVGLFIWTKSAWSFLLLLNLNSIKTNFKRKS